MVIGQQDLVTTDAVTQKQIDQTIRSYNAYLSNTKAAAVADRQRCAGGSREPSGAD